jgi:hypothetical protein
MPFVLAALCDQDGHEWWVPYSTVCMEDLAKAVHAREPECWVLGGGQAYRVVFEYKGGKFDVAHQVNAQTGTTREVRKFPGTPEGFMRAQMHLVRGGSTSRSRRIGRRCRSWRRRGAPALPILIPSLFVNSYSFWSASSSLVWRDRYVLPVFSSAIESNETRHNGSLSEQGTLIKPVAPRDP